MLLPKTRWSIGSPDPSLVQQLCDRFRIRPLLAALLAARGHSVEEAEFFLSSSHDFHDPFLMKGMREAADRIQEALRRKEKLLIYGDYDADGVSSTSLLIRLFRMLDADFIYRIPHRVKDGYGLHTQLLEEAKAEGVTLVVTVDTGITAVEQAEDARRMGLDLIITDHHEPPERVPDAVAVVNPKQDDCTYPFEGLAGVGVAFKLAHALLGRVPEELSAYAALGTVADLMPLTGENRSIVKLGLERLRTAPPEGFRAMLRVAGAQPGEVSANTIGFAIAPRINAVGRLESADDAVKLLVSDDAVEADAIARRLDGLNKERQRMVEAAAAEALEMVERKGGPGDAIVVGSEAWNPGIIGIVASRLVERYYRPTVVLAFDPETGMGKGSARSIPGFHLYDALKKCEELFDHFGGHESATGLSLSRDKLEAFEAAFLSEAAVRLTPELKVPVTCADAELELSDITLEAILELEKLAPYGMAHPAPKFVVRNAAVQEASVIGKDKRHAKFRLTDGARGLEAVGFGFGEAVRRIAEGSRLELIGELSVNEWRDRRTPQIIVKDVSVPHRQCFDWRDASGRPALQERWNQAASDGWRPAFLLAVWGEMPAALASWWSDVPAYRLAGREVVPANAAGEREPFEAVTDLFLAHCPFPYEHFYHILDSYDSIARLYALALGASAAALDRDVMKRVYVAVRELPEGSEYAWRSALEARTGIGSDGIRIALQVCRELRFIEPGSADGTLRVVAAPGKRELTDAPTYRLAQQAAQADADWSGSPAEALRQKLMGLAQGQAQSKESAEIRNMMA